MNLTRATISSHAHKQLARRNISEEQIRAVLGNPDRVTVVRSGRVVAQARLPVTNGRREHLLRVFVDVARDPPEVVTAYRTSKLSKYGAPQ